MPLYNLACDACRILYEDVLAPIAERASVPCDECGAHCRVVIEPVATIGANWSRPIKVGTQTFATNAEFRKANAAAEARGFGLIPKTDSTWRDLQDDMSTRRERTAKGLGYRNEAHRQKDLKRQSLERQKT